jgi:hypothetical protein
MSLLYMIIMIGMLVFILGYATYKLVLLPIRLEIKAHKIINDFSNIKLPTVDLSQVEHRFKEYKYNEVCNNK